MELTEQTFEEKLTILQVMLTEGQLAEFQETFLELHSFDQAQVFTELEADQRHQLYELLPAQTVADFFDNYDEEDSDIVVYLQEMEPDYAAQVIALMYPDNAADALNAFEDKQQVKQLMALMPLETSRELYNLINYPEDTAGSIMTPDYVALDQHMTLEEAYRHIRRVAEQVETIYYVYVVDENNTLLGVISLRELIVNPETKEVHEVMINNVISVKVTDDQEDVAHVVTDYNLLAVPVVGYGNELLGVITVDDIIDVIHEEHESDYSGLAAVDVSENHETPISASRSRLPWLITLLFLGLGTSTVIGQYEDIIESASILSAFVTLITGTAGNAGTQSLAVAVRKLTNQNEEDDNLMRSFFFELLTGIFTGLIVGVAVVLIVLVWKRNLILGLVIGAAMMMAITVANLAGALIPKLMEKLGFDPAVASGPFITTLSDLTSVFIYFSVASIALSYII